MRFSRSFAATARVSSSEKYVIRLIHRPKDQRGGMDGLPVSAVYSSRMSLGAPRNTNRSSSSSPKQQGVGIAERGAEIESRGRRGVDEHAVAAVAHEEGMGLYMRPVFHAVGVVSP